MDTGDLILIKDNKPLSIPFPKKEKIKQNEKMSCNICGRKYTRWNKSKHIATQYHQLAIRLTKKT
jgi:hypothetical protein